MRAPDFWSEPGALARILAPFGAAVDLAGGLRRALARPVACGLPVVCVGNLVAGGAGKTPVARALAWRLAARGASARFLTRGYGGRASGPLRVDPARHDALEVGDEALLLAADAPTWLARDRAAGARAIARDGLRDGPHDGPGVIVMDDGFQNPSIAKDLALLVIDGGYGLGNEKVMPAGPLRETLARGLARADAVVILGEDRKHVARRLGRGLPVLEAKLVPSPDAPDLAGRKVLAFAGIGRPEKFFATLAELGAELAETRAFPDHHPYRPAEIEALVARGRALGALPVTTEKDRVRLPADLARQVEVLPVEVAWRDPEALERLLARLPRHG
jgi:tetraacyldisaccharide 4'-kinase